jgi:hypothetical protein
MGKTYRNHPYQKEYDYDIVHKVTVPKDGTTKTGHSVIQNIRNTTKVKSEHTPVPKFFGCFNKNDNVQIMSLGKNKNWEKEFDLPVLQTEYYHQDKITQRSKVPYPSGCGAGDCNAYGISSTHHIKQTMTNINDEQKEQLNQKMKDEKQKYKTELEKNKKEHGKWATCFMETTKPRLEEHIPFDHYKQVTPVSNQSVTKKQLHKYYAEPCFHCLQNNGKIWMLRGNGNKAMCKNKGMKRIRQRELNDKMIY